MPLNVPFTYSGQIGYLEHIVITMTLAIDGYSYNTTQAGALLQIIDDLNSGRTADYIYRVKRGDISVTLTSPMGTTSTLLFPRLADIVTLDGYDNWPFMSVLQWGENPRGNWTVSVIWNQFNGSVELSNISVTIYGVARTPESVSNIACSSTCARPKGCGPKYCDSCNSTLLRDATTLECIAPERCVPPNEIASGYCYLPTRADFSEFSNGWNVVACNLLILFMVSIILLMI